MSVVNEQLCIAAVIVCFSIKDMKIGPDQVKISSGQELGVICLWNGQLGNPRKHQETEPFVARHTGIKAAERDSAGRVFSATLALANRISVV